MIGIPRFTYTANTERVGRVEICRVLTDILHHIAARVTSDFHNHPTTAFRKLKEKTNNRADRGYVTLAVVVLCRR